VQPETVRRKVMRLPVPQLPPEDRRNPDSRLAADSPPPSGMPTTADEAGLQTAQSEVAPPVPLPPGGSGAETHAALGDVTPQAIPVTRFTKVDKAAPSASSTAKTASTAAPAPGIPTRKPPAGRQPGDPVEEGEIAEPTTREPTPPTTPTDGDKAEAPPADVKPATAVRPANLALLGVRPNILPDGLKVLIDTDPPVTEYHSFAILDPPRLVIDIKGKWKRPDRHVYRPESPLVKEIRVGRHPDYLRIVVEFSGRKPLPAQVEVGKGGFEVIVGGSG
jgi:hypothetical protein